MILQQNGINGSRNITYISQSSRRGMAGYSCSCRYQFAMTKPAFELDSFPDLTQCVTHCAIKLKPGLKL